MLRLQHLQERPGPLASGGRLGTPPHSPRKHGMGPFPKDTAGPWPPVQRDRGGGGHWGESPSWASGGAGACGEGSELGVPWGPSVQAAFWQHPGHLPAALRTHGPQLWGGASESRTGPGSVPGWGSRQLGGPALGQREDVNANGGPPCPRHSPQNTQRALPGHGTAPRTHARLRPESSTHTDHPGPFVLYLQTLVFR